MENVFILSQLLERRDPLPICWNGEWDVVVGKLEDGSGKLEDARDSVKQKCHLHSQRFVNREENKCSSE